MPIRVIFYMEYYTSNEAQAVAQISRRVVDTRGREYEDWSPEEIINPKLKRYSYNPSSNFLNPFENSRRVRKMDDLERWIAFRKILQAYPKFIEIDGYNGIIPSETGNDWVKMIESAASGHRMRCVRGRGYQNEHNQAERVLKPLALLKLKDQNSGLSAEIIDSNQIHGQTEHKVIKILFIMNSGRVAPYKTKAFIAALRAILIDKCGYDYCYGHVADCPQPNHKNNAKKDQRFRKHHEWELYEDGWAHSYEISNLCHYWNLMGFLVSPSPEDYADVAVSFMSDKYKKYLTNLAAEVWVQVFDYNNKYI